MSDVLSLQCAARVTLMDAPMVRRTDVRADLAACTATAAEPARTGLPAAAAAAAAPRPVLVQAHTRTRTRTHAHTHTQRGVFFWGGGNLSVSALK